MAGVRELPGKAGTRGVSEAEDQTRLSFRPRSQPRSPAAPQPRPVCLAHLTELCWASATRAALSHLLASDPAQFPTCEMRRFDQTQLSHPVSLAASLEETESQLQNRAAGREALQSFCPCAQGPQADGHCPAMIASEPKTLRGTGRTQPRPLPTPTPPPGTHSGAR